MPYTYKKTGEKYTVYKKNPDGTFGEKVGTTQGTKEALKKYLAALHINTMKNETVNKQKMTELIEQITRLVARHLKEAKEPETELEEEPTSEEPEEKEAPPQQEEPPKKKEPPKQEEPPKKKAPPESEPESEPEEDEYIEGLTKDQSTLVNRFMTKMVETDDFSVQSLPHILQQIINSAPNVTKGVKINTLNKLRELLFGKEK